MRLSPLNQRRWRNFKANRRAFWSLWIFLVLFVISLVAEVIANDKPILVSYRGQLHFPIYQFYPETAFGGDFKTEAVYREPEVRCLVLTGAGDRAFSTGFDLDGLEFPRRTDHAKANIEGHACLAHSLRSSISARAASSAAVCRRSRRTRSTK